MSIISELQRAQAVDPRFDGEGNVVCVNLINGQTWTGVVYAVTGARSSLPHDGPVLRLENAVKGTYAHDEPLETLFIAIDHIVSAHIIWN